MSSFERLLNRKEAAERLGMTAAGLRSLQQRGCGPNVTRIGRLVRYSPASLERFIAEQTEGQRPEGQAAGEVGR